MPVSNRGARKHVDRARKEIWNQQRPCSQHKCCRLRQMQLALREWATETSDRTTSVGKSHACMNYPARNLHLLLFPQLWSNSATVFLLARSSTRPASALKPSLTTWVPFSLSIKLVSHAPYLLLGGTSLHWVTTDKATALSLLPSCKQTESAFKSKTTVFLIFFILYTD